MSPKFSGTQVEKEVPYRDLNDMFIKTQNAGEPMHAVEDANGTYTVTIEREDEDDLDAPTEEVPAVT